MRRIILLTIAALLVTAAPAAAQATSSATPSQARKPSTLHFDVNGLAPQIGGRLPSALRLTAPGFKANLKALSRRCSRRAAKLNECPRGSLMGRGSLVVIVKTPDRVRDVNIAIKVYLNSRTRAFAVAHVFGWQVIPATLRTRGGFVVNFDPLPKGPPFADVSYTFKRISLKFGAKRVIRKRKRRVDLIRNPATCTGLWGSSISLRFPDGSENPFAAPTPCSRS